MVLIVNGVCLIALVGAIYLMNRAFKPWFDRQDAEFAKYAKLRKQRQENE